ATAHQQFREGRELYRRNQTAAARALFASARDTFRQAEDVFALKPWKYLASSAAYLGDAKEALREGDDAVAWSAAPGCTAAARAHLRWVQGLALGRTGSPQLALTSYEQALSGFESGQEHENAASIHALIAENLEFLGNGEDAWTHRRVALLSAEENG